MFLRSWRRVAPVAVLGLLAAGLMTGCEGKTVTIDVPSIGVPTIPIPTFPSLEEAIGKMGKAASDEVERELRKVIDPNQTIQQQADQFTAKAKELYCAADSSVIADAIKGIAQAVWEDITRNTPNAPQIDLTKDDCAK